MGEAYMKTEYRVNMLSAILCCLFVILLVITFAIAGRVEHWRSSYMVILADLNTTNQALEKSVQNGHDVQIALDEMRTKADQVAALNPLQFLVTPDDIHTFLEQIPFGNPFKGGWYVTSRYGNDRGHSGNPRMGHSGNDIVVIGNDWGIYPTGNGTVVDIGIDTWLGKYVVIEHSQRVRTVYAHLNTIYNSAIPGSIVDLTTRLGVMGETGFADGAHLHYEIQIFDGTAWRHIDAYPYLKNPVKQK